MNTPRKHVLRIHSVMQVAIAILFAVGLPCGLAAAQDDQAQDDHAQAGKSAQAQAVRSAEEILAELRAIQFPEFDAARRDDAEYVAEHDRLSAEPWAAYNALVEELYRNHPDHELAPAYFGNRLVAMLADDEEREQAMREVNELIAADPTGKYAQMGTFTLASYKTRRLIAKRAPRDLAEAERVVEDYIASPSATDEHAAQLTLMVAVAYEGHTEKQLELYERYRRDYPGGHYAESIDGLINLAKQVGEEFELEFDDAVTGKPINLADYRGKVVIIDVWGTWCGPCIAEIPTLRALQEKYGEDLAVIGVCFDVPEDQGGLTKLRDFVKENNLPWPQYYSMVGEASPFCEQWGIRSFPTTFVIDRDGKLVTGWAAFRYEEHLKPLLEQD